MLSPLLFELSAFLLGLLFGSFLNVCISRLPVRESVVKPGSRCPQCLHPIRWHDNVPLLSWLRLRARCRDCDARIPARYPLIELASGIWFAVNAALFYNYIAASHHPGAWAGIQGVAAHAIDSGNLFDMAAACVLGFLLIGLLVIDWQTYTLPDALTMPGCIIGFCIVCVHAVFLAPGEADIHLDTTHSLRMSSPGSMASQGNVFLTGSEHLVFGRLLAILCAAALPFLIRAAYRAIRGHHGLGLGDVKLMAMIAAFLGFWPALLAFFFGCLFIFPYAVFLLLTRRANRSTQLPFGTFLAAGGIVAALMSTPLIAWYSHLL